MALTTVRVSTRIVAEAGALFQLVSEPDKAVRVIEGLESLEAIGPQTTGEGARFAAVMRLGPKTVRAEVELAAVEQDRSVTWVSSHGDDRSLAFELRELDEATAVRLTVTYARPEGMSALLLAPVVEETVRARAKGTLERLRELATDKRI